MALGKTSKIREEENMKIVIEAAGFDAGHDLHHFTRCCAGFELGTFKNRIDSVTIRLGSLEAALDGRNKTCQVDVALSGYERISAQAADADLYVAIFWALERAGWTVAGRLEQEHVESGSLPTEEPRTSGHSESNRAA